jgi:hypothetical protein
METFYIKDCNDPVSVPWAILELKATKQELETWLKERGIENLIVNTINPDDIPL